MTGAPDRLSAALADRYRIERELGAGGMATVYLAADLKHDRKVAIKVLKPELAAVLGAERFVQEIKTTAALSHPHILPLFDSGEADSFLYYVMPYIQGETIREKLNRETQLSVDEAVKITTQIADALDYAHRNGVIHRDIKPENLLLHDGRPMVMDFGIALAVSAAAGGRMTETGLSLGTPHYMSPEQATADKSITARSDVYSLASVCYEMLTGEPPHMGNSAQQIIMKIITDTPRPVTELRKSVPSNVASALARGLEKLPADRFESARAFADALEDRHFTTAAVAAERGGAAGSVRQWSRNSYSRAALALLVIGAGGLAAMATRDPSPTAAGPVVAVSLIDSITSPSVSVALADDGTIVIARDDKLFVRRPGEVTESVLTGADTVQTFLPPVISPDGASLAYHAVSGSGATRRSSLRRIPLQGGTPSILWTAPNAQHAMRPLSWGEDDSLFIALWRGSISSSRLVRLSASGGAVDTLATGLWHTAEVLPGGKGIVGCALSAPGFISTFTMDLGTRDTVRLGTDTCFARWSSTGHLLVPSPNGTLNALPFDPVRLKVTGQSTPVRSGLQISGPVSGEFSVSRSGTLLYVAGPSSGSNDAGRLSTMSTVRLNGTDTPIPLPPTRGGDGAFSPDGRQLAYERDGQLWLYDLDRGDHRQFTSLGNKTSDPVWSPDGTRIAYSAARKEGRITEIYVQAVVGDSVGVHLGGTLGADYPTQWLADGTILTSSDPSASGTRDVFSLHADRPGAAVPILQAPWREADARVSPDGKWLAYTSDETGRYQVVVRTWPGLERKSVIADSTQNWPHHWSRDGRTLYFIMNGPDGARVMAVSLAGTDSLYPVSNRLALQTSGLPMALHPDGQRFLVFSDVQAQAQASSGQSMRRSLIVVTNWFTELRAKLAETRR